MKYVIIVGLLMNFSIYGSQEPAKNYWYNATDADVRFDEWVNHQAQSFGNILPSHEMAIFTGSRSTELRDETMYSWGKEYSYWRQKVFIGHPRCYVFFDPTPFYHDFPKGFVVIVERKTTRGAMPTIRAVSKEEFDKKYEKALLHILYRILLL